MEKQDHGEVTNTDHKGDILDILAVGLAFCFLQLNVGGLCTAKHLINSRESHCK